mmetsp:Transcript_16438/g.25455  ORF Transcript_16438/g.25455 Transcript_16438/m.25455 type:complete len:145 (-) Transcript_16438:364-798(-)
MTMDCYTCLKERLMMSWCGQSLSKSKIFLSFGKTNQGPKMDPKPSSADEVMAVAKETGMLPSSTKSMKYVAAVIATTVLALGNKNAPTIILQFLRGQRFKEFVSGEPSSRRLTFVEVSQMGDCAHLWRFKIVVQRELDANLTGK